MSTDLPVPGDYNGAGATDVAVYRPSTGNWHIDYLDGGNTIIGWGSSWDNDVPVPGDYNGVGSTDVAVYRPNTGNWHIDYLDGGNTIINWGVGTDLPLAGRHSQ